MAVSNTINRVQYAGNGVATEFAVSFPFLDEEDLEVTLTNEGGDDATLTMGTDYTVSGAGEDSGTVTYPVSGDALASGEKLTIRRVIALVQDLDLVEGGGYSSDTLEKQLDKLVMMVQQHQEEIDRKVGVPVSEDSPEDYLGDCEAAQAAAEESESTCAKYADACQTARQGAATSASQASIYASNAETSETNAASYESSCERYVDSCQTAREGAALSATHASVYAGNASTSEVNAAASATAAATSETNAATSETNAAASATAAAASATDAASAESACASYASSCSTARSSAALSASQASILAGNASTSATNASTSETNAATSETNAAASATAAASSATAAATSATNAAASATAAATSETNAASSESACSSYASSCSTSRTSAATSASQASIYASNAAASAEDADPPEIATLYTTRAYDAAAGTVAYTGVGFKPDLIICFAANAGGSSTGLWATDGYNTCTFVDSSYLARFNATIARIAGTSAYVHNATVTARSDDGFTLTWTRETGAGTTADAIRLHFVCIRF